MVFLSEALCIKLWDLGGPFFFFKSAKGMSVQQKKTNCTKSVTVILQGDVPVYQAL